MEERDFLCLICFETVSESEILGHKQKHGLSHYGLMWPLFKEDVVFNDFSPVSTYESFLLAQKLGVGKVYIRNEGENYSGSMKDYITERAVQIGLSEGLNVFSVVSSGNHAVSLAKCAARYGAKAVVFTPSSSSKIDLLASLPNVLTVGVKGAIFEDVYCLAAGIILQGVYNANVNNELLLCGFTPVAEQIARLCPLPHYILAGVGNGSYLAGIVLGLEGKHLSSVSKILPVGMAGAFPTETAFAGRRPWQEYDEFHIAEESIDAAEGSIAVASYSMPQLMYALQLSDGFPLGGLTNEDLREAYW